METLGPKKVSRCPDFRDFKFKGLTKKGVLKKVLVEFYSLLWYLSTTQDTEP